MYAARMGCVMRYDYCLPGTCLLQASHQKEQRVLMQADRLLWRQEIVSHADLAKVQHILARLLEYAFLEFRTQQSKISPKRRAEKPHAVENQFFVVQHAHVS